jgi:isopenicillin-N N-acyltransferase-like protein
VTPLLLDQTDAAARGEAHGETWRAEIRELADIRTQLTLVRGSFRDRAQVLAVAQLHLPELARVEPDLHAELEGIARGAGITAAQAVVLNHYTDLRDIAPEEQPADDGGCTTLYVHGPEGPVIGQTWDMHATAEPFVRLIRVAPRGSGREVLCFTLTGCLGMTGMNERGVAVCINNLSCTDARVGMVWPALIRVLLAQASAAAAHELLMRTELSSGRFFMIADAGDYFGVETTGRHKVLTQTGSRTAHVHTNHCFDPKLRQFERVPAASTTFRRLELASTLYAQRRPDTARAMFEFLASHEGWPRSICSHVDDAEGDPSASRTCGSMIMNPVGGRVLAKRGCGHIGEPTPLRIEDWHGATDPAEVGP